MHIPTYQIHNVLNVYSRQIEQGRLSSKAHTEEQALARNPVPPSVGGKREGIINKVAADIIERITRRGPICRKRNGRGKAGGTKRPFKARIVPEAPDEFVYRTLDSDRNPTVIRVPLEGDDSLLNRLEELADVAEEPEARHRRTRS